MQDFLTFTQGILGMISTFLLTDPIKYFVGLTILAFITEILLEIVKGGIKR